MARYAKLPSLFANKRKSRKISRFPRRPVIMRRSRRRMYRRRRI